MDLQTFLRATPGSAPQASHSRLDDAPKDAIAHIASLLEQDVGVLELLRRPDITLPAKTVRAIAAAHDRLRAWRETTEPLRRQGIPEVLLERVIEPHQRDALERTLSRLPPEQWGTGLDLWDRCAALARKDGAVTADGPPGRGFDEYLRRREPISELAAHRWLRVRRGEREHALALRFDLPADAFADQCALLGLAPAELEPLVLRPLPGALREILDRWAEEEAILSACTLYTGLLTTPPLETAPALALAIGRQLGVAVLDARGEILAGKPVADLNEAAALADRHQVRAIVLPTRAPEMDLLLEARRRLGQGRTVVQVSPAGLADARDGIPQPKPVASAVVLARRALRPLEEWSRIDPVRLGLAEYQTDFDEARLRHALEETREVARIDRPAAAAPRASAARLGPNVKSLEELKPGTIVTGVVTSLTPFGAFVNLGLEQEGMIHVSEIADRFVKDPAEVVHIGQNVLAKVLSVDPGRGRISLSLRREERPRPKAEAANARSKALSALDNLFKK